MAETIIARRYAKALLELLAESNSLLAARDRLADIADAAVGEADARQLWLAPQVPGTQKAELLERILGAVHASPIVHDFCRHLLTRRRFVLIDEIAQEFDRLCRAKLGQSSAVIHTPGPLGEAEIKRLKARLTEMAGKTVTCQVQVDPELIGGIRIRLENTVIDGSVAGRLAAARTALTEPASLSGPKDG